MIRRGKIQSQSLKDFSARWEEMDSGGGAFDARADNPE